ncbi:TonB-dependent siderophore receptor [Sphingomonas liriopis]
MSRTAMMMMSVAYAALLATPAAAQTLAATATADGGQATTQDDDRADRDDILVQARRDETFAGTKTETPLIEVPQPLSVITSDTYLAQGAINISDTVRYAAGVNADAYGRDTRVDNFAIRGVDALQFRDGMRDIFSYYASITSDPYNFSRVEVVRGPASVLFGQGSIGGIVNLVSKTPGFENAGEVQLTYGNYDRKEVLADLQGTTGTVAGRIVARVRDADTYVDHVPDDRVMIAPSVTWRPDASTDVTLIGLYQDDHSGSTANFLPVVGTLKPNGTRPPLDRYLFVGKPGYDRYDGRLLQGSGLLTHRFNDAIKLSLKARYIDSRLSYFTHYTDSYGNPTDPYQAGSDGRRIGLYADASLARMNVFSTDNNIQARFHTGAAVEHALLAGVDYSWNAVKKAGAFDYQTIDLYDIDYAAIAAPVVTGPYSRDTQKQLGLYVQDQLRLWDRVSVVLGARRDHVRSTSLDTASGTTTRTTDTATTVRAGIIGEVAAHISPFVSYTESFQPIAGSTTAGSPFKPQTGTQYEAGAKWQPDAATLVTATAFRIKERNRPISGPGTSIIQAGELVTKGVELEATRTLPGRFDVSLAYGYNDVSGDSAATGYLAKHIASAWGTKTFVGALGTLRLGAGIRYTGKQVSSSDTWTIVTPDRTMVDALVELTRANWRLSLNATNLLDNRAYASCLSRGDCFSTAPRNVMASLGYRF